MLLINVAYEYELETFHIPENAEMKYKRMPAFC